MDKQYEVKLTNQAQSQLREVVLYIANTLRSKDTARRTLDVLEEAINSLSYLPNRYALVDEEPWRSEGVHKMMVKNYLVYYWVDDDTAKVQVTAVVYARRDQKRVLSSMNMM